MAQKKNKKKVKVKSFFSVTKNAKYRIEVHFCLFVTSELGAIVRLTRPFFSRENQTPVSIVQET